MRYILSLICLFFIITGCQEEFANKEYNFKLTINASEGGAVSIAGGEYKAGTEVTVKAIPDSEYIFSGWSNGEKDNPLTLIINSDIIITANFEKAIISKFSMSLGDSEIMMGNQTSITYLAYNQANEIVENVYPEISLGDSLLASIENNTVNTEYDGILKIYGKLQNVVDSVELKILPDYNNWKTYFYPATEAMPNISYLFESVGGGGATVFAKGDLNLDGHEDILFHVAQGLEYQVTNSPSKNNLIALINNGNNSFRDGTIEIFGRELVDLNGGGSRKVDKKDLNCDGYIDFIYAQNREDGRDGSGNLWGSSNSAILSDGDGTYSVIDIEPGKSVYNHLIEIISEGECAFTVVFDSDLDYSYSGGNFTPLNNQYIKDLLYHNRGLGTFLAYDSDGDGVDDVIVLEAWDDISFLASFIRSQGTWTKTGEYRWENVIKVVEDYGSHGYGPNIAVVNDGKIYVSGGWFSSCEIKLYPNSKPLALIRYGTSTIDYVPNEGDTISQNRGPWSKLILFDINGTEMNVLDVIQESEGPYNINFKEVLDLNGDGYDDIAQYPYRSEGSPIVHINNKAGGFDILDEKKLPNLNTAGIDISWWGNPHSFFIDVNNDNLLDLIYRAEGCGNGGYPGCGDLHLFIARKVLE